MIYKSVKFNFPNEQGQRLAGVLDLPEGTPRLYGVFGPCFTCLKESHAAVKVCRALVAEGIAMLRFDTTGVGMSEGDLAAPDQKRWAVPCGTLVQR